MLSARAEKLLGPLMADSNKSRLTQQEAVAQKEKADKAKVAARSGAVDELRVYFSQPLELFSQAAEYVHMHTGPLLASAAAPPPPLPRQPTASWDVPLALILLTRSRRSGP